MSFVTPILRATEQAETGWVRWPPPESRDRAAVTLQSRPVSATRGSGKGRNALPEPSGGALRPLLQRPQGCEPRCPIAGRHWPISPGSPDRQVRPITDSVQMDLPRGDKYNLLPCGLLSPREHMAEEHALRRLAAILAADVAGYSRLMGPLSMRKLTHPGHARQVSP